jgi:hypothetical protein
VAQVDVQLAQPGGGDERRDVLNTQPVANQREVAQRGYPTQGVAQERHRLAAIKGAQVEPSQGQRAQPAGENGLEGRGGRGDGGAAQVEGVEVPGVGEREALVGRQLAPAHVELRHHARRRAQR